MNGASRMIASALACMVPVFLAAAEAKRSDKKDCESIAGPEGRGHGQLKQIRMKGALYELDI